MDIIDKQLLDLLKQNGRAQYAELAKVVGLSVPSVRERILKLEASGVIKGYTCVLDYDKIGYGVSAIILVELSNSGSDVKDDLAKIPAILSCKSLAGHQDLILEARLSETKELLELSERLRKIPGVTKTESIIVLHEYFSQNKLLSNQ
jgi:Lrp/AsnC family transcriptional regulator, leucine-responsive regulatory protein